MSSLFKKEFTNMADLEANVEQDQIGSIYPFEIRPNSYWEKKTELIKEVNSQFLPSVLKLFKNPNKPPLRNFFSPAGNLFFRDKRGFNDITPKLSIMNEACICKEMREFLIRSILAVFMIHTKDSKKKIQKSDKYMKVKNWKM